MDFIFIERLKADAWVGVYAREQAARQAVEIDLTFGVPDAAARADDLAATIDYAVVIRRVREELVARHYNLLETLGEHLIAMMLVEFGASWVKLSIAKVGIARGVARVGVYIERGRDGGAPPR